MDIGLIIALVLLAALVLGINGILFLMTRRSGENFKSTYKLWGKAIHIAKNPWKENTDEMEELSRLVKEINQDEETSEEELTH